MSWWDTVWQGYVSSFSNDDSSTVQNRTAGFGGTDAVPITQWGSDNKVLADAGLGPVSSYARTLDYAGSKVSQALYVPYTYGVSRPLTTAMLLADNEDPSGGSLDVQDAWNQTRYVSPGQEIVAGFNRGQLGALGEQGEGSPRDQVNRAITGSTRLTGFENNGWANLVSGSSDAAFNFMLDPAIAATKGVKVARVAGMAADEAAEAAQIAERAGGLWERLKWVADDGTNAAMVDTWLQGSNPRLAAVLAESKSPERAATVWMAARGDKAAIESLRVEEASTAAAIEANQTALGFARLTGMPEAPLTDTIRAELDDLIARDELLKAALGEQSGNVFVRKSALQDGQKVASRSAKKEADRIALDEMDYTRRWGMVPRTFQRNGAVRPVTVWGGEQPSGYYGIAGSGVDDGAKELAAELNSKVTANVLSDAQRQNFFTRFNLAPSQVQRNEVLMELESTIFKGLAERSGIGAEDVQRLWDNYLAKKQGLIAQVTKEEGKFVDEAGKIHVVKALSSQSEDVFVMPNWAEFKRVLDDEMREQAKRSGEKGAVVKDAAIDAGRGAITAYDAVMQVWRPAALFRLGYTQRNIGEGWLRIAAVAGPALATRGLKEGLPNWAKNRGMGRTAQMFGVKPGSRAAGWLDEYDSVLARGRELDDELAAAVDPDEIALIEAEAAQLRSRAAVLDDLLMNPKYRSGVKPEVFDGVEYPGVFSGTGGRGTREATSEGRTTAANLAGPSGQVAKKGDIVDRFVKIDPDSPDFARALAEVGNKQFRNSEIVKRLLAGDSPADVVRWLRGNSDTALFERSRLGGDRRTAATDVAVAQDMLLRYFPDPNLRALLAQREITEAEVRAAMEASGLRLASAQDIGAAQRTVSSRAAAERIDKYSRQLDELNARKAAAERGELPDSTKALLTVDGQIEAVTAKLNKALAARDDAMRVTAVPPSSGAAINPGTTRTGDGDYLATLDGNQAGLRNRVPDENGNVFTVVSPGQDWGRWQPIHGRELETLASNKRLAAGNRAKRLRDRVYNYIGTLPTDTLLRHPFTNERYKQYMEAGIAKAQADGVAMTADDVDMLVNQARRFATRETKRTLYTIERYSDIAGVMRFISPFFAAFENTAKTWGRIAFNDPSVVLRGSQIATAPIRGGFVTDEDGNPVQYTGQFLPGKDEYITFQIPESVAGKIPGLREHSQVRFSPKSLNVVLQGENWWSPGFGPLVQIPVSEMVKANSDEAWARTVADQILTTGPSDSYGSWDMAAPAVVRRVVTLARGEDSREFATQAALVLKQDLAEREQSGRRGPAPTKEQAIAKTRQFYAMRILANLLLPLSPQFQLKPETQFAIDVYRRYRREGNVDGLDPDARFLRDFPQWFNVAGSSTSNTTGINPTLSAERNRKKYTGAIDAVTGLPGFQEDDATILGLLVNDLSDTEFDDYAYTAQQGTQVSPGVNIDWRGGKDIKGAAEAPYVSRGWADYQSVVDQLESAARSRGFASLADDENLMAIKRQWLATQKTANPAWFAVYSERDDAKFATRARAVETALADPVFAADKKNDPTWQAVSTYMQGRKQFLDALAARDAAGGSADMRAVSNEPLAAVYLQFVQQLKFQAPQFGQVFDRYFDGEFVRAEDERLPG